MKDWSCYKCRFYEWGCEFHSWYGDGRKGDCPNYKEDPQYIKKLIAEEMRRERNEEWR